MRYIDADALIADGWHLEKVEPTMWGRMVSQRGLKSVPTADVVEVVRCKDCIHWIYWADEKRCSCDLHHIRTHRVDFCSYGERK